MIGLFVNLSKIPLNNLTCLAIQMALSRIAKARDIQEFRRRFDFKRKR